MNPQLELMKSQPHSAFPKSNQKAEKSPAYRVGLATAAQKEEVFRLRYNVFHGQNELNTQTIWGDASQIDKESHQSLDFDVYDSYSDHMIVTQEDEIVGTYRMISVDKLASAGLKPYSANEFHLDHILHDSNCERILELGRSCIHPDHRNGTVLRLLWAALSQYLEDYRYDGMFGSVSLFMQDKEAVTNLGQNLFNKGYWCKDLMDPMRYRHMQQTFHKKNFGEDEKMGTIRSMLPPLMKGYLNLGAKICDGPFYDDDFKCFDYLMFIRVSEIPDTMRRLLSKVFSGAKI